MNTRDCALARSLLCAAVLTLSASPAHAQSKPAAADKKIQPSAKERDGSHDFDFIVGTWKVHHRRLRNPLTGSNTWVEFDGTSVGRTLWDGRVSEDENVFNDPAGRIEGMTVRFYNPKTHQWSIWWASNSTGGLALPPIVGQFDTKNGRGEFYDQEPYKDRMILVRYIWFDIKENSSRWEQAFSDDGGKTWETNWIQYLERVKDKTG
jgi:hypothetical protein